MFNMTGTTGSTFTGVLALAGGRIGIRDIGSGEFRVRVEPKGAALALPTWKQPDYQQKRYSKVVIGSAALAEAVAEATVAVANASISNTKKVTRTVTVEDVVAVAPYIATA